MEVKEPAAKYYPKMTAEQYLEWERKQEYKHEYAGGQIIDMAGASPRHNKILSNLITYVGTHLKGKDCDIYPSDLRIYVKNAESYFYPDASIVCGDLELSDDKKDSVKNPSVIFEILSPSTADYDLGRKLFFYMQIETLREYYAIDSSSKHIRIGRRRENNTWQFEEISIEGAFFSIETIDLKLAFGDIYEKVKF
jgi:Uma2 family endonuclease